MSASSLILLSTGCSSLAMEIPASGERLLIEASHSSKRIWTVNAFHSATKSFGNPKVLDLPVLNPSLCASKESKNLLLFQFSRIGGVLTLYKILRFYEQPFGFSKLLLVRLFLTNLLRKSRTTDLSFEP